MSLRYYYFALAIVLLLFIVSVCSVHAGNRKADLVEDFRDCTVHGITKHNSFYAIKTYCHYWDWYVDWMIKETLYISKKGYVIKLG